MALAGDEWREGPLLWNGVGDATPSGAPPPGWWRTWHSSGVTSFGPTGSIDIPDNSATLNALGGLQDQTCDPAAVETMAYGSLSRGNGFGGYHFNRTGGVEKNYAQAVGRAWRRARGKA